MIAPFVFALVVLSASTTPKALMQEGVRLRKANRDAAALEKFQEAFRLSKSNRALAQIALAEQALGRWLDAEVHLMEALRDRRNPWIRRHRASLSQGLETIRGRLVTIDLEVSVSGADIQVNGRSIGHSPLGRSIRAVAGTVVVEITAEGYWPLTRRLDLSGGSHAREMFVLVEKPKAEVQASTSISVVSPSNANPSLSPSSPDSTVTASKEVIGPPPSNLGPYAYATGGIALAAAGVGGAFLVVRNNHARQYNDDEMCLVGGRNRDENCRSEREAAKTAELTSILAFAGAGLFGIASVVLFILDGRRGDEGSSPNHEALSWVDCGPGPGDIGVRCSMQL